MPEAHLHADETKVPEDLSSKPGLLTLLANHLNFFASQMPVWKELCKWAWGSVCGGSELFICLSCVISAQLFEDLIATLSIITSSSNTSQPELSVVRACGPGL